MWGKAVALSRLEPQKIPLVMSQDETRRLLAVASSLKVRVLLSLGYGCGLRAGEVMTEKVRARYEPGRESNTPWLFVPRFIVIKRSAERGTLQWSNLPIERCKAFWSVPEDTFVLQ